jgi:hypothetical protein
LNPHDRRTATLGAVSAGVIAVIALGMWLAHAWTYFYLFDDFALVGQASEHSARQIATLPLFGFYRPVVFLATKAEFALFGWSQPAGYLLTGLVVHVANGGLLALLAWRLWRSAWAAVVSGVALLCSPWASEAVFWASGAFDVFSAFGWLLVLHGTVTSRDGAGRAWPRVSLVAAGTVIALFSKEAAVALAAVLPVLWFVRRSRPAPADVGAYGVFLVGCALYLALRSQVLSVAGGVYGGWWSLMSGAPVADNLIHFGHAFLYPPVAHDAAWRTAGASRVLAPGAVVVTVLLVGCAWVRWRDALVVSIALLLALAPVLWVGVAPLSSGGGRVLYASGLFLALLLGLGVDVVARRPSTAMRMSLVAGCTWLGLSYAVSLHSQRTAWGEAIRLSRAGIEAFRPWVGQTGAVHIRNLPFWFAEGPYVLKSYAFQYYYRPATVPSVTATAVSLTVIDGKARPLTRGPEPGTAPADRAGATEISLSLGLD